MSNAPNERQRDTRERQVVHDLYRRIAIKEALLLLENLRIRAADVEGTNVRPLTFLRNALVCSRDCCQPAPVRRPGFIA